MKKKIFIIVLAIIIILIIGYNYIYQEHRDIGAENAVASLSSVELLDHFLNLPEQADSLYLDKTIEITGMVSSVGQKDLVLDSKIFCAFPSHPKAELNSSITVKGRCIGYDELLEEVKLDQCVIVE